MPRNTKKSQKKKIVNPNQNKGNVQYGLISLFPQRLHTKLRYVDELTLSTTAGANTFGAETTYRMNDLYDPYFPVGGHQPYGFDQITPWYFRYIVTKCDIKLTFYDPSDDGIVCGYYCKNLDDPTTLVGNTLSAVEELQWTGTKEIANTGSQKVVLQRSIDQANFMGLTPMQYACGWASTGAYVTATPTLVSYLSIAAADSRSAGTAKTIKCRVELIFHAQFWERKTPAQS